MAIVQKSCLAMSISFVLSLSRKKNVKTLTLERGKTFMWSDSAAGLQCMHFLCKQPVFVASRVAESLAPPMTDKWNYVKPFATPTDAGTRGLSANALVDSSWLNGPEFLKMSGWPFKPSNLQHLK